MAKWIRFYPNREMQYDHLYLSAGSLFSPYKSIFCSYVPICGAITWIPVAETIAI